MSESTEPSLKFRMGQHVKDRITGISGIVAGIQFHYTGLIRCEIHPVGTGPDGKPKEGTVVDEFLLELDNSHPDVTPPEFPPRTPKFKLLSTVRDRFVPGFVGTVICYIRTMNGCIYYSVQPNAMHEGRPVPMVTHLEESWEEVAPATQTVPAQPAGGPRNEPVARR